MGATTIRIFLADGTPHGIRILDKSNWTGRGVEFSRLDWPRARIRDDLAKPGVYVLTGEGDDGLPRVYIGEADLLSTRIAQHYSGPSSKEFWTRAVAFSSTNDNLNKAHVRHIEARLVGLAQAAKRCKVENSNLPSEPKLSEYDRAEAESFLEDMLLIYPFVGIDAFTRAPAKGAAGQPQLQLKVKSILAHGQEASEGFVVFAGSRASMSESKAIHAYVQALREHLVGSGVLAPDGDAFVLSQDYTFNSPSTAAAVLLGRISNGRMEWKDASGTPLKTLQENQAG
jgi:hypothetical protein